MGLVLVDDDLVSIDRRVREGDPTVGWRGDPTMDVYVDNDAAMAYVYGFDIKGLRYRAASISTLGEGWRHDLLAKLRDGDWRDPNSINRADEANRRLDAERDYRLDQVISEVAEKFGWGLRRDVGHHFGGTTKEFF